MVKNSPNNFKTRLLNLYNKILNCNIPQQYKTSVIVPILKPNADKTLTKSYRPISLNSCFAKILDKIIANRLWWFLNSKKLLNSHQMGFRKEKSTADAFLYVDHLATSSLSARQHLTILSLDFERAYDEIGLHTIVDQLIAWHVGQKIINYIVNFMSNRKITVRVGNTPIFKHYIMEFRRVLRYRLSFS